MQGNCAVAEVLATRGLTTVFAMLGGTNVPWIGAGVARGVLRLVATRHESTAVSAAVGFARASGTVGLCSVTRGPGFANAVNALIAAVKNHSPVVLLVGDSPMANPTTDQDIDQEGFTRLIGAGFRHAETVEQFTHALDGALADIRRDGTPQVLSLSDAVLAQPRAEVAAVPPPATPPPLDPVAIEQAVDLLAAARSPLILAGQGAVHADARDALVALAEAVGARLATSILAHRYFAGHPLDLGLSGGWAPAGARPYFREADLVLVFGASFNQFTYGHGQLFADVRVVHCDASGEAIGRHVPADVAIVGDAREAAAALLAAWQRHGLPTRPAPSTVDPDALRESVLRVPLGTDPGRGIDPRIAYRRLDEILPPHRLVVTDSGRSLPTLPSIVRTRSARDFLVGRGYGSIGLGLGTALGAACARPEASVVLFCGDGGLMMSAQDLDAIRLAGLRLTIVVMNDRQYGSEVKHLRRFGLDDQIARQPPPDLVQLAEVFGGTGCVVRTEEDFDTLRIAGDGLQIIDVRIDPEIEGDQALGAEGEARLAGISAP